jgi:hypothetical protein
MMQAAEYGFTDHVAIGTVRKSMVTVPLRWLLTNVCQHCVGWQGRFAVTLPTVAPATPYPSLSGSPWIRSARCWALLLVRIYECLPWRCRSN